MGKAIGILSLKGGVGKTSVVSNLGSAIADFCKKVLLIDWNLSSPNLGMHFNIVNPEVTLHHVLDGTSHMKDAVVELKKFDLVPSSMFPKQKVNPLKLKDKIKSVKKDYDAILIDSSPALSEETLATMLASDIILVATTPDYSTLSTTLKAIKLAKLRGAQIDGLIINKFHNKNFELSIEDIEGTTDIPVMAVIPYDVNTQKAQAGFVSFTDFKPNSNGAVEYKKLAATLIGEKYKPRRFIDKLKQFSPSRESVNREIYYNRVFR